MQGIRNITQSIPVCQNGKLVIGEKTTVEKAQPQGFGELLKMLKTQLQQLEVGNQNVNAEVPSEGNSLQKSQFEQALDQVKSMVKPLESEQEVQEDELLTSEIKLDVETAELQVLDNENNGQLPKIHVLEDEQKAKLANLQILANESKSIELEDNVLQNLPQEIRNLIDMSIKKVTNFSTDVKDNPTAEVVTMKEEQLPGIHVLEDEQKTKLANLQQLANESKSIELEGTVLQNLPQEIRNLIDMSIKKVTNFPTDVKDNPITLPISDLLEENSTAKVVTMLEEQTPLLRNMEKVIDLNKGLSFQHMVLQQDNVQLDTTNNKSMEQVRASHFVEDIKGVLKQQLTHFQNKEMSQIRVMLNPEHLGHLDILISEKQGKMHAQLLTSTQVAKETLELQIHALKTTLINQGINVDKIEVSQQTTQTQEMMQNQADSRQQKQQFSEQQGHQQKSTPNKAYDNEEQYTAIDASNYEQREYVTQVNYVV
jgi:flagellar hook-length control protein FliK